MTLDDYFYLRWQVLFGEDMEDLRELADTLLLHLCMADPDTSNEEVMIFLQTEVAEVIVH